MLEKHFHWFFAVCDDGFVETIVPKLHGFFEKLFRVGFESTPIRLSVSSSGRLNMLSIFDVSFVYDLQQMLCTQWILRVCVCFFSVLVVKRDCAMHFDSTLHRKFVQTFACCNSSSRRGRKQIESSFD